MKNTRKKYIALAALACFATAGALAVRTHYESVYRRSSQAYKLYQARVAAQAKAVAEARSNEARLAALQQVVERNPNDLHSRWLLAGGYQRLKMVREALVQLQAIYKADPKSSEAALGIANAELALGRVDDSERAFIHVTRKWPKNVEGWQGLAATQYRRGRFRDAGEAATHAMALDRNDLGTKIILASSALEFGMENPDEHQTREPLRIARTLYQVMLKDDPENGQTHYQLGLAMHMLRDKAGSLEHLQKAVGILPNREDIAFHYAEFLLNAGKRTDARAFLTQACTRMPKVAGLFDLLAESYQYESDPKSQQEAIRASQTAVALAPTIPTYWDHLGAEYLKAQDVANARMAFEKSLLLDVNRSYPYQQLAGVYTRLGDPKRASAAAKMASRMMANDEQMRHLEALSQQYPDDVHLMLIRADRYRDLKQYGPARDLYAEALKVEPANTLALRGIAMIDKALTRKSASR